MTLNEQHPKTNVIKLSLTVTYESEKQASVFVFAKNFYPCLIFESRVNHTQVEQPRCI